MKHVNFSLILALLPLRNIALRDSAFRNVIDRPQSNVTVPVFMSSARAATTTTLERTTVISSHYMNDHPHKSWLQFMPEEKQIVLFLSFSLFYPKFQQRPYFVLHVLPS